MGFQVTRPAVELIRVPAEVTILIEGGENEGDRRIAWLRLKSGLEFRGAGDKD